MSTNFAFRLLARRLRPARIPRHVVLPAVALALGLMLPTAALAQSSTGDPPKSQSVSLDELVSGVVRIRTLIAPDGRTIETLGRERQGSGVVIDGNGLVLTIGYLMVEAASAEITTNDERTVPADVVGYDYDTGFGLLRASAPLKVRPMPLGRSADVAKGDRALVAAGGGADMVGPVHIVARREFAGYWEYLLEEALFTAPPHPAWSGAALISREGKLLGIGSLVVGDAARDGTGHPGNMFVPIDRLGPILADLVANGQVAGTPRPWLGLNTDEIDGRLVVRRVMPGGPADKAGIRRGDAIVGVAGGAAPRTLADLYRRIWGQGRAGITVPLEIQRDGERRSLDVRSINRLDHLKLNSTF